MTKAVIFDLDGTLLDRDKSVEEFVIHQHGRLHNVLGHISQTEYTARFIELEKQGYVWKDKVYQQLVIEFDIKAWTWRQLLEDYLANFASHCVPFPCLISMLEELKKRNIRLGMITNGFTEFQTGNIKALGIEGYFDAILISEQEDLRKPDTQIFIRALERLGVQAEDAMFVGDHPLNDVEASNRAGMTSVWKQNSHWESAAADRTIDRLDEIPELI